MSKLRQLVVLVRDISHTVRFFGSEGIGLKVIVSNDEYAELEASEHLTISVKQATREAELCKGYTPFLVFDVPDVDSLVPNLIMKGAALDGGVKHEPEGKFALLRSPDGLSIGIREVLFNPAQLQMMKDADASLNRAGDPS